MNRGTEGTEAIRAQPKFKVGQIVVLKNVRKQLPFRVLGMTWESGWYYQWNKKNFAAESMLRELTAEEKGEA